MKIKMIKVMVLVGIVVFASSCQTQTGSLSIKKSLEFGAGFASGVLFHEVGHYTVAELEGMDNVRLSLTKVTYEYDKYNKSKKRNIAFGGFAADIISSEILLANDKHFPKNNSFILGWLTWTIFEPISYTLRHEFSSDGYGDLRDLEDTGVNSRVVEAALIAHGIFTYYRLTKNPDFPLFVRASSDKVYVGAKWRF